MLIMRHSQLGNLRTSYLMFETGHQIDGILITEFCHFNEIKSINHSAPRYNVLLK